MCQNRPQGSRLEDYTHSRTSKEKRAKKTLSEVKEKDLKMMEETIQMACKQMEDNQKCCDSEISKLQKHYDTIVSKLNEIKKNIETKYRESLTRKNAVVNTKKIDIEKNRQQIKELVKFLGEKHSTMSDYSLIDNLRDLSNLVYNTNSDIEKGDHLVRYRRGDISEGLLESMIGQTFNLDNITVTERYSFQYGDCYISAIQGINEDTCFMSIIELECVERIDIKNQKSEKINIKVKCVCVTDNSDVYATDSENNFIVQLSPSGSVFTVFSTAPLRPLGICQSTEAGLLITLRDTESEPCQPDSHSRRLVRHVTLTGDVIHEYEYQEDGQTRLFTAPVRVSLNGNTDICVVNLTSDTSSELVILSISGSLKLVYRGQDMNNCFLSDVLCDSYCNIILCETFYSQIHLLSPDGEFLKYLLTDTEVTNPYSMSLYISTLWVGNAHELLKVFQYKS